MNSIRLSIEIIDLPSGLSIVREVHSWVKAIAQIYSASSGEDDINVVTDTAGATFTLDHANNNSNGYRMDAALNDDTHGLLVGTGTTAVAKDDNTIETKINDGSAAGELVYNAMVVSATTAIAGGYRVTLSRQFDNDSGGDITVKECGLVVTCRNTANAQKYALIVHDLQTQLISDTTSKIFKYHIDFLF